mmetsp:Transcript_39782/g.78421  ORF Transcript_39782/g.78421 Transcript_39782/m.78421 type:complete len:122 (-) Transcript_39782:92-457(-)
MIQTDKTVESAQEQAKPLKPTRKMGEGRSRNPIRSVGPCMYKVEFKISTCRHAEKTSQRDPPFDAIHPSFAVSRFFSFVCLGHQHAGRQTPALPAETRSRLPRIEFLDCEAFIHLIIVLLK